MGWWFEGITLSILECPFCSVKAAEVIGGFARGSKLWPYEDLVTAWSMVLPLVDKTMATLSNEATGDWAACVRFCAVCVVLNLH